MRFVASTLLALSVFSLTSCAHLVTGKSVGYPKNGPCTETANVQFHGASGRSFVDRTKKHFLVFITRNRTKAVFGPYKLTAAGLDCDITWVHSGDEVTIDVFEFPVGVTGYEKNAHDLRTKRLSLQFVYDPTTDRFSPFAR
jgi:hypothetical protein